MNHESSFVYQVQSAPEVTVRLRKMTYGRRGDLLRKMGELTKRAACLAAGASEADHVSAEVERHDADRILMAWAIEAVDGLTIDGKNATAELLIEAGPEEIVRELLGVVHREIGLSPEEIKKLIVAFHFYKEKRAGWECDECRKAGLEKVRRCGYLGYGGGPAHRPVWVRRGIATEECPRSLISNESESWLGQYAVRKLLRDSTPLADLDARVVDAMVVLESETRKELDHCGDE